MVTLWLFCILDYCFPLPTLSLPGSFPTRREGGFFGGFLGCFDVVLMLILFYLIFSEVGGFEGDLRGI